MQISSAAVPRLIPQLLPETRPIELAPAEARLSSQQRRELDELKATDERVRAHERAHRLAGGQYAGAAEFSFQNGPDGRQYAVAGEVPIDASVIPGDPQATVDKMQVVISAALAPVDPSAQDRRVAARARSEQMQAELELAGQAEMAPGSRLDVQV